MLLTALIFAALAALVHVYIFVLESVRWTAPGTRKTFGTSQEEANATKELAFNQGFYNLFLAAGLVLLISSPAKAKAALVQLAFPLLAVVFALVSLA
ncbi:DUF1304 domain-containing protein [Arthrobacter sp. LAPM80]|uniref:DUF1304 domain-containing protein n=1 Tax=Arthrobacter sp. LAPM80 TaxID=3141788 RepID=UPI00398A5308